MPSWLRGFLEVLAAQLAVALAAWLLGGVAGRIAVLLTPYDPMNLGRALAGILTFFLVAPLSFLLLWLAVWWWVFRRRMAAGRFLASWAASLAALVAVYTVVSSLPPRGPRPMAEPLVLFRARPDGPAFALAMEPGEHRTVIERLIGAGGEQPGSVVRRCETLADGEACFLLVGGNLPPDARLRRRVVRSQPVWWMPGWLRDVEEGFEERPLVVRDAPPPRIAALSWPLARGRLVVKVESPAPLVVDAFCFRFDGGLVVRTGAGGDALRPGGLRSFADGEWSCADPELGVNAGSLPALVAFGERIFELPSLPGFDDPETSRRIAKQIRERGLAGGRRSIRTDVRLLAHYPDGTPVRVDARFVLEPGLSG